MWLSDERRSGGVERSGGVSSVTGSRARTSRHRRRAPGGGSPFGEFLGVETRYVDDGTAAAFLITLLALTSLLPAEIGRDLPAACAGSAAFGFFLVIPAVFAFDSFGGLDAGAWLGLCTALIPIGALIVLTTEGTRNSSARIDRGPGLLAATVGLVLIAVGIWLDVGRHGQSYWNASSSGHAVGLLLIVLVVTNAVLLAAAAHSSAPVGHGLVSGRRGDVRIRRVGARHRRVRSIWHPGGGRLGRGGRRDASPGRRRLAAGSCPGSAAATAPAA